MNETGETGNIVQTVVVSTVAFELCLTELYNSFVICSRSYRTLSVPSYIAIEGSSNFGNLALFDIPLLD